MKTKQLVVLSVAIFSLFAFQSAKKIYIHFFNSQSLPTEKVYLHLDKPHYALGSTVWFKAYMQTENFAQLDSMSKVLYVELIKPDNQLHQRLTLKIKEGSTNGDFVLADTLSAGNYRLRAYTNYMRNFDNFFEKDIAVLNPKKKQESDLLSPNEDIKNTTVQVGNTYANFDFQFFPEGGDLVENLQSVVAFKATMLNGKAIKAKGEIFDNEHIKVAIFQSNEMGTGKFKLSPLPNRTYTAKVVFENGMEKSYELPKAQKSGFVMTIDNSDKDKLKIKILKSVKANLTLIAQQYGKVYFMVQDSSDRNAVSTEIAKNIFPSGIVHFTLFDEKNIPHCERLVWTNHFKTLNLDLQADKKEYKTREKVTINLGIDETNGDFSVAVTDTNSVEAHKENILTYHLLTSELKGYIEKSMYYFEQTAESNKALDNLLLTQGWRRFTWKQRLNKELPSFSYQMEHGISVRGTANDEYGKMVKNKAISFVNTKTNFLAMGNINEKGEFVIEDLEAKDSTDFLVRVEKEKNVRFKFMEKNYPVIQQRFTISFGNEKQDSFLVNSEKAINAEKEFKAENDVTMLKAVTIKDKKIEEDGYVPTVLKLHGQADVVVKGEVLSKTPQAYQNIIWGLQGRAAGVMVEPPLEIGDPPVVRIRASRGSPLFLFDGVIVTADFFSGINPNDIDYIEVLKNTGASIYGSRGDGGVIAVYSKKGPDRDISKYLNKKTIQGFYTAKEFYSPNYENPTETEKLRPDYRTTLYWNPSVKTDANGKASFSFFCADVPTKYRIVVEGRSKNGTLGRKEIFVEVRK